MADISTELHDIEQANYGREVRGSIHAAIRKINEVVENVDETVFASYGTISATDAADVYQHKMAYIVNPGAYMCSYRNSWTDTPDNSKTWGLLVFKHTENYVLQVAFDPFGSASVRTNYRIVKISTHTPHQPGDGWMELPDAEDLDKLAAAFGFMGGKDWTAEYIAQTYDNKVSNIRTPGTYFLRWYATNEQPDEVWTDLPLQRKSWGLLVFRLNDLYYMQIAYDPFAKFPLYYRTVGIQIYPSVGGWTAVGPPVGYNGKKVSVYGDSISTYTGYALGYDQYPGNAAFQAASGVTSVNQTWWMQVINRLGMELLSNASIMGRCVTEARQDSGATVHLTSAAYRQSRIDQLKSGTTVPDVILVKIGVNDFNHGAYLGELEQTKSMSDIEAEFTAGVTDTGTAPQNAKNFTQGYKVMLKRLMETYPLAEIWCCTIDHMKPSEHGGGRDKPEVNRNGEALSAYNQRIVDIATQMGCKVIRHDEDGISAYNQDQTTADTLHPNAKGMTLIANQTLRAMG